MGLVVGVDLGGTKILARLVDPATGKAKGRVKNDTPAGSENVLDLVAETVKGVDGWEKAAAIGVGVPGIVEPGGIVASCPNIVGWDKPVAVAKELRARLDKDVFVANDVNCGAVAEHRLGSGRGLDSLLAVFVGTGVGGGLILDGRLVRGARGMVGEIGHVTVEPGGRPCGCGGLGHLESYAGRASMTAEAYRQADAGRSSLLVELAGGGLIKSRHIKRGLDEGDELTEELMAGAADALAQAIGNAATLLDLPAVVFGGGVVDKLGDEFLERIRTSERFGGFGPEVTDLVLAHRLDDAGVAGAAIIAADGLA